MRRRPIIAVTHDEKTMPTFRRIYHIRDGRRYERGGVARSC
jgi:putative ABC transport system ATP-binding protein